MHKGINSNTLKKLFFTIGIFFVGLFLFLTVNWSNQAVYAEADDVTLTIEGASTTEGFKIYTYNPDTDFIDGEDEVIMNSSNQFKLDSTKSYYVKAIPGYVLIDVRSTASPEDPTQKVYGFSGAAVIEDAISGKVNTIKFTPGQYAIKVSQTIKVIRDEERNVKFTGNDGTVVNWAKLYKDQDSNRDYKIKYLLNNNITVIFENEFFDQNLTEEQVANLSDETFEFGFNNLDRQFQGINIEIATSDVQLKHQLSFKFYKVDITSFQFNANLSVLHAKSSKNVLFSFENSQVTNFNLNNKIVTLHTVFVQTILTSSNTDKAINIKDGKIVIQQIEGAIDMQDQSKLFVVHVDAAEQLRKNAIKLENINIDFNVKNTSEYRIANLSNNAIFEINTMKLKFSDQALQTQADFAIVAESNTEVESVIIKDFEIVLENSNPESEKTLYLINGISTKNLIIEFKEKVVFSKLNYELNNVKVETMSMKNVANTSNFDVRTYKKENSSTTQANILIENCQFTNEMFISRKTGETLPIYVTFTDIDFNVTDSSFITSEGDIHIKVIFNSTTYIEDLYIPNLNSELTIEPSINNISTFNVDTNLIISVILDRHKTVYWNYEVLGGGIKQYLNGYVEGSLNNLKGVMGDNIKLSPVLKKDFNFNINIRNDEKMDIAYNSSTFKHLLAYSTEWGWTTDATEFEAEYPNASEKIVLAPSNWDGKSTALPLGTYQLAVFEKYSDSLYLKQTNIIIGISSRIFVVRAHRIKVLDGVEYKWEVSYGDNHSITENWVKFVDAETQDFNKMDIPLTMSNFELDPNAGLFVLKDGSQYFSNTQSLVPGIYKMSNQKLIEATNNYTFIVDTLRVEVTKKTLQREELQYKLYKVSNDGTETEVSTNQMNTSEIYSGDSYLVKVEFAGQLFSTVVTRNKVQTQNVFNRVGEYEFYPKLENGFYYKITDEAKLKIDITPVEINISNIKNIFEEEYMYNKTTVYQKQIKLLDYPEYKNQLVVKDQESNQIMFKFTVVFVDENVGERIADVTLELDGILKENYKIGTVNGTINGINFVRDGNSERRFIARGVSLKIIKQVLVYEIVDKNNEALAIEYFYEKYVLSLMQDAPHIYRIGDQRNKFKTNITIEGANSDPNLYKQYYIAKLLKDAKLKLVSGNERGLINRTSFFFEIDSNKLSELYAWGETIGTISELIKVNADDSLLLTSNNENFDIRINSADLEIKPFIIDVRALNMYIKADLKVAYDEKYKADNLLLSEIFADSIISFVDNLGQTQNVTEIEKVGQYNIELISNKETIAPKNETIYFNVLKYSVDLILNDLSFETEQTEDSIKTAIYEAIGFEVDGESIKDSISVNVSDIIRIEGLTASNIEKLKNQLGTFMVHVSVDDSQLSVEDQERYNFRTIDIAINRVGDTYNKDNVQLNGKILYANKVQELKIFDATNSIMAKNFADKLREHLDKNKKISKLQDVVMKTLINIDVPLSAFENNSITTIKIKLNGKYNGYKVVHYKEKLNADGKVMAYIPEILDSSKYQIKGEYLILKDVSDLSFYGVYKISFNHATWAVPLVLLIMVAIIILLLIRKGVFKIREKKSSASSNDGQNEDDAVNSSNDGAAEKPVVEEAVSEELVAEDAVDEEPVAEDAVDEEPVAGDTVEEELVAEEPAVEALAVEEPVVEEPIVEESVLEEPVTHEPVVEEPTAEEKSQKKAPKRTSKVRLKERKGGVAQYIEED